MKAELDRIINEINSHPQWSLNIKMRYAYLELGKIVHKDYMFFYTIQNNLLNQDKSTLKYDIDKLDRIINMDNNFDYKVVCKASAEMLKYIYDNCGIKSEIRRTMEESVYQDEEGQVTIRHFFLVATGDDNKNYFITLNPDLPNIQIGRRTCHFGNIIEYMTDRKITNESGNKEVIKVQNYEGEEIDYSTFSQEELKEIDKIIGYANTKLDDNKDVHYTDVFFDMIKNSYKSNQEYLDIISSQTEFFYDLSSYLNGTKSFEEILNSEKPISIEELKNSCFDFNINEIEPNKWENVKKLILLNVILKLNNTHNIPSDDNTLKEYLSILEQKDYKAIFDKFKDAFFQDEENKKRLKNLKGRNPLSKLRQLVYIFTVIDKFSQNKYEDNSEFHKLKTSFATSLKDILTIFVPDKYLPHNEEIQSSYLTHKILISFNNIFDIGNKTSFNNLDVAEQVTIIKEIMNIVLDDIKEDPNLPHYDPQLPPIKNRILSTVIFDKKTRNPYYLMCVKNTKSEQADRNGLNPIIFDLKNNLLITNKSMTEIYNDNYIIRDADMKLMIEEIESLEETKERKR